MITTTNPHSPKLGVEIRLLDLEGKVFQNSCCIVFLRAASLPLFLKGAWAGWPRFGSVTVCGCNGSSSSGFRLQRFQQEGGFSVTQHGLTERDGSGFSS